MANAPRLSVITDWSTKDDDLPDVTPGETFERVIASQKFIVLHRIRVVDLALDRLEIGVVKDIPFELDSTEGTVRTYRLKGLDDNDLKQRLVRAGAAAMKDAVAIAPTLERADPVAWEVRIVLRNDGSAPAKPRAALIVQEEGS